ncbi:MAG: 4-(cytidine 5'-diphospho)-2-C-methyl-D-erythritol kinase [Spirochaetia bacterium]
MDNVVRVFSPAKVNIHLAVGMPRADGFHSIESLFIQTDFGDSLVLRSLKKKQTRIVGKFSIPQEENLVWKAVQLFNELNGTAHGYEIYVEKRIPQGAGLGGGSSNAAAVLRALNRMHSYPIQTERLIKESAALGSDVPFFLTSAAAYVSGRGEETLPIEARSDFYILLAKPDFSINTKSAYSWYDEYIASEQKTPCFIGKMELVSAWETRSLHKLIFFNSFENVLGSRYPIIKKGLEIMKNKGAMYSTVSGSGSAFFGIFPKLEDAKRALLELNGEFPFIYITKPLEKEPECVVESC